TNVPYADEPGLRRREAYSWGGLTSGAGSRAWWMLLLPFMLANVAFWMFPAATLPNEKTRWPSRARDLASALQRLFSLSLTVSLPLSVVSVATDLVGWQCGSSLDCRTGHWFLDFMKLSFFMQPSRRLAIATIVPVLVVALLWWLGHASWNAYELLRPPVRASAATSHTDGGDDSRRALAARGLVPVPPIGRRRVWECKRPDRPVRWPHVSPARPPPTLFP